MGLKPQGKRTGRSAPAGLPARGIALDLLSGVLRRHRPLDESFESHSDIGDLDPRDRAFVRSLVWTTLRRLGEIDGIVAGCLDRPLPRKAGAVEDVLRLGVAQIRFLESSPHAAVDTAVELVRSTGLGGFKGLVNAVLRRVAREEAAPCDPLEAGRLNTPDWLWARWVSTYGEATASAIAAAHLNEPPLDLTVPNDVGGWAERLGGTLLPTGTVRLSDAGAIPALPGYDEGAWWVQDAAAALPARLLGDVGGKRVVDLCAAPGGKTAQLAAAGAQVVAVERTPRRAERLRTNLARLRLEAEVVEADAADWRPDAPVEAVLLDAPCTATGTIRRHPDIAYLKKAADIETTARVQARLLRAARSMVAPGGLIVFVTCSLEAEEGERLVEKQLAEAPDLERVPVTAAEVGGLAEAIGPRGDLRTLPCHLADFGGMDGFFAARLRRLP